PDFSVQILRRLLPLTADDLDRLAQLGLIEIASQPKLPSHRRYVRAADRVAELANGELRLDPEVARVGTLTPPVVVLEDVELTASTAALVVATGIEGSGRATFLRRFA